MGCPQDVIDDNNLYNKFIVISSSVNANMKVSLSQSPQQEIPLVFVSIYTEMHVTADQSLNMKMWYKNYIICIYLEQYIWSVNVDMKKRLKGNCPLGPLTNTLWWQARLLLPLNAGTRSRASTGPVVWQQTKVNMHNDY